MHALSWRIQSGSNGICHLKENYKRKLSRVTRASATLTLRIIAFVSCALARFRFSAFRPRQLESRDFPSNRALGTILCNKGAFFIVAFIRELFRNHDKRNICNNYLSGAYQSRTSITLLSH